MTFQYPISSTCDALHCFQFGARVGKVKILLQKARDRGLKKVERAEALKEARYHAKAAREQFAKATADARFVHANDLTPEIVTLPKRVKLSPA